MDFRLLSDATPAHDGTFCQVDVIPAEIADLGS
jgi:hypothetical protein